MKKMKNAKITTLVVVFLVLFLGSISISMSAGMPGLVQPQNNGTTIVQLATDTTPPIVDIQFWEWQGIYSFDGDVFDGYDQFGIMKRCKEIQIFLNDVEVQHVFDAIIDNGQWGTFDPPNQVVPGLNTLRVIATDYADQITDVSIEGFVPYITPPICELLGDLTQMVEDSSDDSWVKKNRKATMINKLTECIALCEAEEYEEIYDKILHDVKPKLTGLKEDDDGTPYGNGVFENAWITNPDLLTEFEDAINEILSLLSENGGEPPVPT